MIGEPVYTSSDGTRRPCSHVSPVHAARIIAKNGATLAPDVLAALKVRAALADATGDDRCTPIGTAPGRGGMIRTAGGRFAGAYDRDAYTRPREVRP